MRTPPFCALVAALLTACDPAATTRFLVRPDPSTPVNRQEQLQTVEIIGSMLEARGFARETYDRPQVPREALARIENQCGHMNHWSRVGKDGSETYTTYARACFTGNTIIVTLSDYPRFSRTSATTKLAADLSAQIQRQFANALVQHE